MKVKDKLVRLLQPCGDFVYINPEKVTKMEFNRATNFCHVSLDGGGLIILDKIEFDKFMELEIK
jgi:hypothetical protein